MSLPNIHNVLAEEQSLTEKVTRLEKAYALFMEAWSDVQKEQHDISKAIAQLSDNTEMMAIIDVIHNKPNSQ